MMRCLHHFYILLLLFFVVLSSHLAFAQESQDILNDTSLVEDVELSITWLGREPSARVSEEVRSAVDRTLQLAILEQLEASLIALENSLKEITSTLKTVISLSLEKRGIQLEDIEIVPGRHTKVMVSLRLMEQNISHFQVEFRFKRITPFIEFLTAEERSALTGELEKQLGGTPYTDEAWVEKLVREQVDIFFTDKVAYEDFKILVFVVPQELTSVYLTFIPKDEAILLERFYVKLRSDTLLNIQMETIDSLVNSLLSELVLLPMSFIDSKRNEIAHFLNDKVTSIPEVKVVSPSATSEFYLLRDEMSYVLRVESAKFRLRLQGRVDVNRERNNSRFDLTAGILIGSNSDVFFHGTFYPGAPEFRPQVGVSFLAEPTGFFETAYDFKMNSTLFRTQLNVLPDFYLSAERYLKNRLRKEIEFSMTYIFRNLYEFKLITNFKGEIFGAMGVRI